MEPKQNDYFLPKLAIQFLVGLIFLGIAISCFVEDRIFDKRDRYAIPILIFLVVAFILIGNAINLYKKHKQEKI